MSRFKYDKYDFSAGVAQYKAIMNGQDAAFAPATTQMAEFCMKYGGHNGRKFFSDPELFVRGNLDVQQEFGFDVPDMVWDVYSVEAEALGGDMAWFDDLYPALDNTRPIIETEKDLARMKAPDPFKTGRMPWVLEVLQLCQELTGFPHHIHYCAPINLCAQVMQFEKMVVAIAERPQFVHKVMNWLCEEVLAPYINAYFKVVPGAEIANGKDAVGSLPFITEEMVHEFSVPYLDKLRKLTGNRRGLRCDNWWGDAFAENAEEYWDIKLQVTPQYLKVQDPDCFRVGTERIRKYADKKGCALSFGVGTLLLQKGTREDIIRRVHEYMEVGSRGPHGKKFFLYFCSFSAQTPVENVRTAIEAVKMFRRGELPYAGEVLSGPGGVAAEMAGGKGFMGMSTGSDADKAKEAKQEAIALAASGRKPIFQGIYDAIMEFDGDTCAELVAQALEDGESPNDILDEGLIPPMGEVGDLFAAGEFFVPEMLMAAKAMKQGLEVLRPIITAKKSKPKGVIVTATVFGDLHDIGKNLVGMMLEGAGFKVVDLGVNVKAEMIIETARKVDADVIGLSALLTTTMPFMKLIVEQIKKEGMTIPVICGGAPVSRDFAMEIGANGYGDNAPEAVELCKRLVSERVPA
ncbi:MAG: cobalamin-dependent protein [Pseudorhodoplanes sp.]|uniref:cobalamin-dependent protein n=1 Tax=Pseudorhodoplanes sp. TaxID=1934341 RepID=UPI003D134E6B